MRFRWRYYLGTVLLLAGLWVTRLGAFEALCDNTTPRSLWMLAAAVLFGFSALAFARHPRLPAAGAWAIAAVTTVVAFLGLVIAYVMLWAGDCSN